MDKPDINVPSWNDYFILLAHVVSLRSPDPATKHGSVLCDKNHKILGMGYNGYPRGCIDQELPKGRPDKYDWIIHSEINCILNSNIPSSAAHCTLYVTGHPCISCLKTIAQTGIKKIVYGNVKSNCIPEDDLLKMQKMCEHTGITLFPHIGKLEDQLQDFLLYLSISISGEDNG